MRCKRCSMPQVVKHQYANVLTDVPLSLGKPLFSLRPEYPRAAWMSSTYLRTPNCPFSTVISLLYVLGATY